MANILVVENEEMAMSIEPYRNHLPNLKHIIVYDGLVAENSQDIISWQQLMKIGDSKNDDSVLERQSKMAINECCVLVYTSGTTGNPKGITLILFSMIIMLKPLKSIILNHAKVDTFCFRFQGSCYLMIISFGQQKLRLTMF